MQNKNHLTIDNHSLFIDIVVFSISTVLVIIMNRWLFTWLFVPVVALVMFVSCGMIIMRIRIFASFFKWLGSLSACIFVCHPIVRFVINRLLLDKVSNLLLIVLIYISVTILVSMVYDRLFNKLISFVR